MEPEQKIPEQETGIAKDLKYHKTCASLQEAKQEFDMAAHRLADINNWNEVGGIKSAKLSITDHAGNELDGIADVGLYVKIDLPAPGNKAGDGSDWVRIEDIEAGEDCDSEWISMRLRPTSSPVTDDESIAHFFDEQATSNFVIKRTGTTLYVHYAGRNEVANTDAEKITDKIRNAAVATGARFGFSDIQWSGLAKGLIDL